MTSPDSSSIENSTTAHDGSPMASTFPHMLRGLRTGIGTDVHAFADSNDPRPMWIGCLEWPGENGLVGHSDADVVAHSCADAMFSAAAIGDLGTHFGTSEPRWAGASGEAILKETRRLVEESGCVILSVSVQLIGPRPRIGSRRHEVERQLSSIIGCPVAFSATTTDGLGFPGHHEGLAAIASALVWKDPHRQ